MTPAGSINVLHEMLFQWLPLNILLIEAKFYCNDNTFTSFRKKNSFIETLSFIIQYDSLGFSLQFQREKRT